MRATFKNTAATALLVLGIVLSVRFALGFRAFLGYQDARGRARSIESGFADLERRLTTAVRRYPSPDFLSALGALRLEMAEALSADGDEKRREEANRILDLAEAAFQRLLRTAPLRATAWYDLGRVYLLYDFPVLPYRKKARACLRRAMELAPADAHFNVNGLFVFLTEWNSLGDDEREFVRARLEAFVRFYPEFANAIRRTWKQQFGAAPVPGGIL